MLDLRPLAAAPLLCLLACTGTGDPEVGPRVPAVDPDLAAVAAVTLPPRPPRPAIVGATVASSFPAAHLTRCDDSPARLELIAINPDDYPASGRMVIQLGRRWFSLPLRETRYDTVVIGNMAAISVIQVFHNPTPGPVAATYSYPLPPGAAVDDYWIRLADRELHGVVKPIGDARELHEQARAVGHVMASLEHHWPDLFTQTVADVPPGATVEIEMRLIQPLRRADDRHELDLPMTFGSPGDPHTASSCSPVDVQVTIEAGFPAIALSSKWHALTVEATRDRTRLELTRGAPRPNHDLELAWQIAGAEPRAQMIAQKKGDGGHFMLTIEPPQADAQPQVHPRELVFALDTSVSMRGQPLEAAVDAIRRALVTMGPDDTFQIVRLTAGRPLAPAPLRNTHANLARATAFLKELHDDDGRETLAGVAAALARGADPERLRIVLFLTDGELGDEARVLAELAQHRGDARLYTLGLGSSKNRHMLDGIARLGRGAALQVGQDQRWVNAERLQERIGAPLWTDLEIDWGPLAVTDVVPAALPDLFAGQPVVVYGRFTGAATGAATLKGKYGGVTFEVPLELDLRDAPVHARLHAMWARRQIDALLEYPNSTTSVPNPGTVAAVTELAIAHRVTTDYTSFVTIETRAESQPDGTVRSAQVPVAPPGAVSGPDETIGFNEYRLGGGHDPGDSAIRVPTVYQTRPHITGALDKDIVLRILRARIDEVRECRDIGLARDRNLGGSVSVEFMIDATGKVTTATIKEENIRFFRGLSGSESGLETRREKAHNAVREGHGALQASSRNRCSLGGRARRARREGEADRRPSRASGWSAVAMSGVWPLLWAA